MINTNDFLNEYIVKLLHINEESSNKLIDLNATLGGNAYVLENNKAQGVAQALYATACAKYGKPATVTLNNSSATATDGTFGYQQSIFDWRNINGGRDIKELLNFKYVIDKETTAKGNNPLFLSIGAIRWTIALSNNEQKNIVSPLIIFPIRLIKNSDTSPILIEFVADDVYLNPCFYYKLSAVYGDHTADQFPLPCGNKDIDDAIDLSAFTLKQYFDDVQRFVDMCTVGHSSNSLFCLDSNIVAISGYKHSDMCMYYDLRRNKDYALAHPLVNKLLNSTNSHINNKISKAPQLVLPYDTAQETIIARVIAGDDMIIKGPPGSGKTQTIANMIAALLSENKSVLFTSKKLSALGEVYNKLPQSIQTLALRLDSESEAQASKIDATAIHKQLTQTFRTTIDKQSVAKLQTAKRNYTQQKYDNVKELSQYLQTLLGNTFEDDDSIYNILVKSIEHNCTTIAFDNVSQALNTSASQFALAQQQMSKINDIFDTITDNRVAPARHCPWLNTTVDNQDIATAYSEARLLAQQTTTLVEYLHNNPNWDILSQLTVAQLRDCIEMTINADEVAKLLQSNCLEQLADNIAHIVQLENTYRIDIERYCQSVPELFRQDNAVHFQCVNLLSEDNLTIEQAETIIDSRHIFNTTNGLLSGHINFATLKQTIGNYFVANQQQQVHLESAQRVFDIDTLHNVKHVRILNNCYSKLSQATSTNKTKLSLTEKVATRQALALAHNAQFVNLETLTEALANVVQYYKTLEQRDQYLALTQNLLCVALDSRDMQLLRTLLDNPMSDTPESLAVYYRNVVSDGELLKLWRAVANDNSLTLSEVRAMCKCANADIQIKACQSEISQQLKLADIPLGDESLQSLKAIGLVIDLAPLIVNDNKTAVANSICTIVSSTKSINSLLGFTTWLECATKFFDSYLANTMYNDLPQLKLQHLSYITQLQYKNVMQSCIDLADIVHNQETNALVVQFVAKLLDDISAQKENIEQIFAHSYYVAKSQAIEQLLDASGNRLHRQHIQQLLDNIGSAETKLLEINANLIQAECIGRIDKDSSAYNFLLSDKSIYKVCRLLFADKAQELLSLKRCHILSPSTVSLLYRNPSYSNFDVLIVDEASQLPPEQILPSLMRSKQCVIVGDEHQMPPIVHFVRLNKDIEEQGYEPIASVLDLAKRNSNFDIMELKCHYRSKAESLIAFSGAEYYPYMFTFPATVPRADGIGIVDIYKENGYCDAGQNIVEAEEVVKVINNHFDKYYDATTRVLSKSIGIVVFGEKQEALVNKTIAKDKKLYDKINHALTAYKDSPEKLFFVRTILTVQGQETDHLVLSFTYGKREDGSLYENFGDLSKSYGKQIFNVAVTRGKSCITVIHSFLPSELKGHSFIAKYLTIAEMYSSEELHHRFVSEPIDNAFVCDIANYIASLGIDSKRIVTNYGVTKTSIRIPIAILSEELDRAILGIWCETNRRDINYIDANIRYYNILQSRDWRLYPLYIYDWIFNNQYERNQLQQLITTINLGRI